MNHDEYHRKFADAIIEQIRKGTAPWQKPWAPGERVLPMNVTPTAPTGAATACTWPQSSRSRGYGDVRWGTYRQIQARGGQVRKGERGTRILSFQDSKRVAVTDERGRPRRDAEGKRIYRYEKLKAPFVRQYTVFNAEQADGLPERANPDARAALEGAPGGREGDGGRRRAHPPRPGRPRLLPHEARRDRAARARPVPLRQPLLPDRAPRAGPQHRPREPDEARTPSSRGSTTGSARLSTRGRSSGPRSAR